MSNKTKLIFNENKLRRRENKCQRSQLRNFEIVTVPMLHTEIATIKRRAFHGDNFKFFLSYGLVPDEWKRANLHNFSEISHRTDTNDKKHSKSYFDFSRFCTCTVQCKHLDINWLNNIQSHICVGIKRFVRLFVFRDIRNN